MSYSYLESQEPKTIFINSPFDIADPETNNVIYFTLSGELFPDGKIGDNFYANKQEYSVQEYINILNSNLDCSFSIADDGYITKQRMFELFPKLTPDQKSIIVPVVSDTTTIESTPTSGLIRYNISKLQFEGYSSNIWQGLGGVADLDQDTKIIADDSNILKFFTNGTQRMIIDSLGHVGIGKTTSDRLLDVSGDIYASGDISSRNLTVAGNLQVDGSVNFLGELVQTDTKIQVSEILDISANDGSGNALTVRQNGTTQDIAHFYNGTSPAMVIDKVGNVGIGTNTPSNLLDIYKYSGLGQPPMLNIVEEFRGDTGAPSIYTSTLVNIQATGSLTQNTTGDTMIGLNVDIGSGSFAVTNKYAALFNGGDVGIGTTTPSYKLHVNGSVGGQTFTATSDIRFKENIVDLSNALQKICSIRGVNYNFKDSSESKHAGVIAQEVDEIIPEAINKNDNEKWSVNYNTLFSYYVEAIKELNHKNDDFVLKNNELIKTVESMKSMVLSMRDELDSLKKH